MLQKQGKMCQCLTLVDEVGCALNSLLADGGDAMNKLLTVTVLAALLALSKSNPSQAPISGKRREVDIRTQSQ